MPKDKPDPKDYEGIGRTLPGALPRPDAGQPPAEPRESTTKDEDLPQVAPGGRYALPRATLEELLGDYE